jgi:GntR family transcriptional repressor for pyruvate dehydrogenase complex
VSTLDAEPSAFQRLERPRLSQMVAEQLEETILAGTLARGSRLPSEQALADQFGVSRNVVREAFKILEERGLVQVIGGSGTFVCEPSSETTTDAFGRYIRFIGEDASSMPLLEARLILEGATARLASQRAEEADLAAMAECMDRMRRSMDSVEAWTEADLQLHLAVAKATHNPFLMALIEPLVGQVRNMIVREIVAHGATDAALAAHELLCDRIKRGDAEGAQQAMEEHLRAIEEHQTPHEGQ